MAGPWEKYQKPATAQPEQGPWTKYQAASPAPAVNPNDLANQALAVNPKSAGITVNRNTPVSVPDVQPDGAVSRFAQGVGRAATGLVQTPSAIFNPPQNASEVGLSAGASVVPGGAMTALALKRIVADPAADQYQKAKQEAANGNYFQAGGHGLAAALPVVGPFAASLGERAGQGDIAGALGEGVASVAIPKAVGAVAPRVGTALRDNSYELANSYLGTRSGNFTFGKNPGRGIVEEGIVAGTKPGALGQLYSGLKKNAAERDAVLSTPQNAAKVADYRPVVSDTVDNLYKSNFDAASNGKLNALNTLKNELTNKRKVNLFTGEVSTSNAPKNMNFSPLEATKYKTQLGNNTAFTGEPFSADVTNARRSVYGAIDKKIDSLVPEVAPQNAHIADLIGAGDALQKTIYREQGHNVVGLRDLLEVGSGVAGGHPLLGVAGAVARRGLASSLPMTGAAQGMNFAGRMLQSAVPRDATFSTIIANPEDKKKNLFATQR